MSATTIFFVTILVVFVLAGAGIFAVAFRRPADSGPVTGSFDTRAARRDRERILQTFAGEGGGVATAVAALPDVDEEAEAAALEAEDVAAEGAPPVDPIQERVKVSSGEYGTTRRMFLNRSLGGLFGFYSLALGAGILAMLWPRLKGGFGTPIAVGTFADIRDKALQPDGTVIPQFFAAAQTWVVPFNPADLPGSSFEAVPTVVAGGGAGEQGLMALWQRCVHLGCRVPSCVPSQGFECPCHGSKYNLHGEYEAGPAPRNMDRFGVEIDDAGNLVVLTGEIVQTPRAHHKTIQYPLGPFCV